MGKSSLKSGRKLDIAFGGKISLGKENTNKKSLKKQRSSKKFPGVGRNTIDDKNFDLRLKDTYKMYTKQNPKWKNLFNRLSEFKLKDKSGSKIFASELSIGPERLVFNNYRFAIMYFELFSHNYNTKADINLYFSHTHSNFAKIYKSKVLEKKNFKNSPILKKRLKFEPCEDEEEELGDNHSDLFKDLGIDDSESEEEIMPLKSRDQNIAHIHKMALKLPERKPKDDISKAFDDMLDEVESISSDEEPKVEDIFDKVKLSNKKFLNLDNSKRVNRKKNTIDFKNKKPTDQKVRDESNKENVRNKDNFLCKRANPETDFGVIRIPNPYKSSYTMEYDRWRTENEEKRKALVQGHKMVHFLEQNPFLTHDLPLSGTAYYKYVICEAESELQSRYGIRWVIRAIKVSKRINKNHNSTFDILGLNNSKKSCKNESLILVSIGDIENMQDFIYEPSTNEEFLPFDIDTRRLREQLQRVKKLEDFLRLEKNTVGNESTQVLMHRFSTTKKLRKLGAGYERDEDIEFFDN